MSRMLFMKKKLSILCCLIALAVLSGCSLAADSGDGAQARDRLIGGLLTKDYIEKTYATAEYEDGRLKSLDFEGIDGHYAVLNAYGDQNGELYYNTIISDGTDVATNYGIHDSDGEENRTIELKFQGHVLVDKDCGEGIAYLNPVYMTADGRIYTVAGNSGTLKKDGLGASMGWGIDKTVKMEIGNWKEEVKIKIFVDCALVKEPTKVIICQMDKNHETMTREDYLPDAVPEKLSVEEGCEYVMILTECVSEDGQKITDRQAVSYDGNTTYTDENIEDAKEEKASLVKTDYTEGTGFVLKHSLWILWP